MVLLLLGMASGAVYYFKFHKPKTETRGPVDLDGLGYGAVGFHGNPIPGGIRTVVLLQNNLGTIFAPTLVAVPISSKIWVEADNPTHYRIQDTKGLRSAGTALGEQIITIHWDYLRGSNPAMAVELLKYKKTKREAWTDQETRQALACCDDPFLLLPMYLALGCSMRIGESLGLTWDCVHIEENLMQADEAYLRVEKELRRCTKAGLAQLRAKGRDDVFLTFPSWKQTEMTTDLVLKTPKTESSVRNIYIPGFVAMELKKQPHSRP